jgi:proton-dependent oligopeptide transporter, POT family
MSDRHEEPRAPTAPFPRSFWTANVTELFERGAYYAMASFVVIYLGRLGLGKYWPSTLNSWLWGLVYFLPVLSGTIADRVGFKKSLLTAFVLLTFGYLLMGSPVWFASAVLSEKAGDAVTTAPSIVALVMGAVLLIGVGGSIVKPCISGTVQKTSMGRATLAFAIFYMVINVGSLFGRGASYYVRTRSSLPYIFAVSMTCVVTAFFVVFFLYSDVKQPDAAARPSKSPGQVLLEMALVLKSPRFVLFLLVNTGFSFLYSQVYNVLPLYVAGTLEKKPAMDVYTMANPLVIVCLQLVVTRLFGRMAPVRSMFTGTVIIAVGMVINVIPLYLPGGPRAIGPLGIPIGSLFIIFTVALVALGELFAQARIFEYLGALAPKGQEGLFLGYANLPQALGSLTGGPVGAYLFHNVICRGATKDDSGLLVLNAGNASQGWMMFMGIGLVSAAGLFAYDRRVRVTASQ